MTAPQLVILADDLTGAADTGGSFAGAGLVTAIPLNGAPLPPVDVLSISSESRDVEECEVEARLQATLIQAQASGPPARWYKKIDSVLRGHPGLEIALTMETLKFTTALCAPALPAEGRATIDARVYVHGLPLHTTTLGGNSATSFIVDRLRRSLAGRIVTVGLETVRRGPAALTAEIGKLEPGLIVIDATTDDDLHTIASVASDCVNALLVGSAGLASALQHTLPLESLAPRPPEPLVAGKPVLIVSGTRHEAAVRQIEYAEQSGITVIRPQDVEKPWTPVQISSLQSAVMKSLASGKDTILTITCCPDSTVPGHVLVEQLAIVAAEPCRQGMAGGLILTGGDVAAAVCAQLGCDFLWLRGEVLPAIPWATLGSGPLQNLPVVTKAGSFGGAETFTQAVDFLKELTRLPTPVN